MAFDAPTFFDPAKAKGPRREPDVGPANAEPPAGGPPAALSVSGLIAQVKGALDAAFPARLTVIGEISNLKPHSSGHLYFRLKDANASIDAVMFRSGAAKLKFRPTDGLEVVVQGRVDVYDVRGQLQFYVETMTPRGKGALELAFQQLREKLQKEGLFDPAHKISLPTFPRAVGIVTSSTGAAIADIRRTLRRRWPGVQAYLVPVAVQGEGAAAAIAEAIGLLDRAAPNYEIDVMIVGRGGGSLEDLWAFNEEVVARAIYAAQTPIISGVGHEVDVTICDLVADVRAATPTAAAELAVPESREVLRHIVHLHRRMDQNVSRRLQSARAELGSVLRTAIFRDPCAKVHSHMQRVDDLARRLEMAIRAGLSRGRMRLEPAANRLAALHPARLHERARSRLGHAIHRLAWVLGARSKRAADALAILHARLQGVHPGNRLQLARQQLLAAQRQLEAMSYRGVLNRGYSVTRDLTGAIIRSADDVGIGSVVVTEVAAGRISSRVEKTQSADPATADKKQKPKLSPPRPAGDGETPGLFD